MSPKQAKVLMKPCSLQPSSRPRELTEQARPCGRQPLHSLAAAQALTLPPLPLLPLPLAASCRSRGAPTTASSTAPRWRASPTRGSATLRTRARCSCTSERPERRLLSTAAVARYSGGGAESERAVGWNGARTTRRLRRRRRRAEPRRTSDERRASAAEAVARRG